MMKEKPGRSSGGSLAAEAPSKAAEVELGQPSGGDADAERGAEKEEEGGNIGMENGGEQQDTDRTAAAASTSGKVSCYSRFALPNTGILRIVVEKNFFGLLAVSASKPRGCLGIPVHLVILLRKLSCLLAGLSEIEWLASLGQE